MSFLKGSYPANSTLPNIMTDITSYLTMAAAAGTATKAAMVAMNNVNTAIWDTVASGWTAEAVTNQIDIYDQSLAAAVNIGTVTDCIYVKNASSAVTEILNGFYLACGSTGLATSTDGKVWATRDAGTSYIGLGVAYNGAATTMVAIRGIGSATPSKYSTDPATWSNSTTNMIFSGASRLATKGSTIYVPSGGNTPTNGWTTTDGITYTTTGTLAANLLCTATDGTNVVMIGVSVCWRWNGSAWSAITGVPTGTYRDIVWTGTYFVAIGDSGIVARSTTGASGTWTQATFPVYNYQNLKYHSTTGCLYATSSNGVCVQSFDEGATWVGRNIPSSILAVANNAGLLVLLQSSSSFIADKNKANRIFKAPNADGLGGYKYIHVILEWVGSNLAYLYLKAAESYTTNGIPTYLVYLTDHPNFAQRIDITAGGILYISASNRNLDCMSFLTAGSIFGSVSGAGALMLHEYTRDDGWNTHALGYPTFALCNSNTITVAWYSPRLKNTVGADVTGNNAVMLTRPLPTNTKAALDNAGATIYPANEMGCYAPSAMSNAILGGVFYGLKNGTDSIGVNGSDTVTLVNGDVYFLMIAGSTLSTTRLLVPRF